MIEVTLEHAGRYIDLRVPRAVTLDRLTQLIRDGFAAKGATLPDGFSLAFEDKPLAVSGSSVLASFGIGNGDRLRVIA